IDAKGAHLATRLFEFTRRSFSGWWWHSILSIICKGIVFIKVGRAGRSRPGRRSTGVGWFISTRRWSTTLRISRAIERLNVVRDDLRVVSLRPIIPNPGPYLETTIN